MCFCKPSCCPKDVNVLQSLSQASCTLPTKSLPLLNAYETKGKELLAAVDRVSEQAVLSIAEAAEALLQFLEQMRQQGRGDNLAVAAVRALGRHVLMCILPSPIVHLLLMSS